MSDKIKLVYDYDEGKFFVASQIDDIALHIVAAYEFELSPGGEIIVSTTVTSLKEEDEDKRQKKGLPPSTPKDQNLGQKLYSWLRKKGCSIVNKILTTKKMDKIIRENMTKGGMQYMGWSIEKGIRGRYTDIFTNKLDKDSSWRIVMNGTPISVIEAIATELCKAFKQQTVLIHDFEKNTFKYWNRH